MRVLNALSARTLLVSVALGVLALVVGLAGGGTSRGEAQTATLTCTETTLGADPAANRGLAADCDALLGAKATLAGMVTLNWSASTAIGSWEGVTVAGTPKRVTNLNLGALGLTGTIPAELGLLTGLRGLWLSGNQLTGPLPTELGNLSRLTGLGLSGNRLTGGIPVGLGRLTNLTSLWLQRNRLDGAIPAELGNLASLRELYLGGNTLTGCLPPALKSVATNDLASLGLDDCAASLVCTEATLGADPAVLPELEADCNTLLGVQATLAGTGTLNWSATTRISSWDGVTVGGTPKRVTNLNLGARGLTGTIPAQLGRLTNLTSLWLSGNQLTGGIPVELGQLTKLRGLGLSGNRLTGAVPAELGNLASLRELYLSRNRLTGCLPLALKTVATNDLARLGLDDCADPLVCTQTTLGADPATNRGLEADCNTLLGAKATLAGSGTLNWSAGTAITSWDGVTVGGAPKRVTGLRLARLGLTGVIPAELGSLTGLRNLALFENRLAGPLPPELGQLANLASLYLGRNRLTGAIPPELGSLTNLRDLWLQGNRLTGDIPSQLEQLTNLRQLYLGGNALTGCVPPALKTVAGNDLARLGLDNCDAPAPPDPQPGAFRYNYLDTTGRVEAPGSYAFLKDSGDEAEGGRDRRAAGRVVLTTYEELRKEANRLLVHEVDAGGTSHAGSYDAVRVGDLIEWRKSEDCFVRYRVRSLPAAAQSPREFGVEQVTYAFTGCLDGTVPASEAIDVKAAAELPDLGGTSLRSPVVHGRSQIVPEGWTGAVEARVLSPEPEHHLPFFTTDLAEARKRPFWREPALPGGWTFVEAYSGGVDAPSYGYCSRYTNAEGYGGVDICGYYATTTGKIQEASWSNGRGVAEARTINGRAAVVLYSPQGPNHERLSAVKVWVHDAETESTYWIGGGDISLRGSNVDAAIAIARSLFESPNPR